MSAIQILIRPIDPGATSETSLVSGANGEGVLQVSGNESDFIVALIAAIRGGQDTTLASDLLPVSLDVTASADQLSGLNDYIEAIGKGWDTSAVETAIGELTEPEP